MGNYRQPSAGDVYGGYIRRSTMEPGMSVPQMKSISAHISVVDYNLFFMYLVFPC